ncbi:MAG: hypothetical protein KF744_12890 [Taibaiella sp.]|nr:hypothetical protein [Taibaiella sp.]
MKYLLIFLPLTVFLGASCKKTSQPTKSLMDSLQATNGTHAMIGSISGYTRYSSTSGGSQAFYDTVEISMETFIKPDSSLIVAFDKRTNYSYGSQTLWTEPYYLAKTDPVNKKAIFYCHGPSAMVTINYGNNTIEYQGSENSINYYAVAQLKTR